MKMLVIAALLALPAQEKSAQDLLKGALAEAKEKNRRVLLTFGGAG
jgi:hypothetical protein